MADLQPTDQYLVERNNTSYKLTQGNLMAELQDTDLMLVERSGVSYKATGADIKGSFGPPPDAEIVTPEIISPVDGAGDMISATSDVITDKTVTSEIFTAEIRSTDATASLSPTYYAFSTNDFMGESFIVSDRFKLTNSFTDCNLTQFKSTSPSGPWTQILTWQLGETWSDAKLNPNEYVAWATYDETPPSGEVDVVTMIYTYGTAPVTTLTLASNNPDLALFTTGDNVQQNEGYNAQSDTITNVSAVTLMGDNVLTATSGKVPSPTGGEYFYDIDPSEASLDYNNKPLNVIFNGSIDDANYILWVGSEGSQGRILDIKVKLPGFGGAKTVSFDARGYLKSAPYYFVPVYTDGTNGGTIVPFGELRELYTFYIPSDRSLDYFRIYCDPAHTSVRLSLWGIYINGVLVDNNSKTLSLSGDKDLDVFDGGDVVQGYDFSNNVEWSGDTFPGNAFDGDINTSIPGGVVLGGKLTINKQFTNVNSYRVYLAITRSQIWTINGKEVVPDGWSGDMSGKPAQWWNFSNPPSTINQITIQSDAIASNNIAAIEINGVILVDTDETKVVSTDLANNKMVVDGGTWANGDTVECSYTPATGVVSSVDTAAATMTLASSDDTFPKRWIDNGTRFVKGEEKPSQDAAPAVDITFQSNAFASTPEDNLDHESSDWEIAAKADINYASVLQSSLNSAVNLTSWKPPVDLAEATAYRARVRYKSTSGVLSDWGESVFKTEGFDPTSKVWSDYVYQSNSTYNLNTKDQALQSSNPATMAFDGDIATEAIANTEIGGWMYFIPDTPIAGVTSLRIRTQLVHNIAINGVTNIPTNPIYDPNYGFEWYEVTSPPSTLLNIAHKGGITPINSKGRFAAIEINGEILTDSTTKTAQFFDENTGRPMAEINLMSTYGVDPTNDPAAAYRLGIYPIVEQAAGYGVSHYVKEGSCYCAVAYPYSLEEQQTMDLIRVAKVKLEEVKAWVGEKREES